MEKFLFRGVGEWRNTVVLLRDLHVDELDGVIYFSSDKLKPGSYYKGKKRSIPDEFFLREFMALDTSDVNTLLDFQNEYGLITSPNRAGKFGWNVPPMEGEPMATMQGSFFVIPGEDEGLRASRMVWNKFTDEGKSRFGNDRFALEVSSLAEIQATVSNMKDTIRNLVHAKMEIGAGTYEPNAPVAHGLNEPEFNPMFNDMRLACISHAIDTYIPFACTINIDNEKFKRADPVTVPLTVALYAQLAAFLADGESVHKCANPLCNNLFQYQRGGTLRHGNLYCSPECQQLAKDRRKTARKREEKKKNSAREPGKPIDKSE